MSWTETISVFYKEKAFSRIKLDKKAIFQIKSLNLKIDL